jgi:TP901-1 family phage major tail protein
MGCNTEQNEVGGKQLLLKVCQDAKTGSVSSGDTTLTITAHGAIVGDIARFLDVGTNGNVNTDDFYFVKTVEDANGIQISATRGGSAINFTAAEAALSVEIFKSLGGLRSKSMSFSSESIDITSQDSDEWNKILDGAGIRSFEFSGGGVYTNEEVFQDMRERAMANELVCLMVIDVKANRIYEGCFKVTSLEISGDYDSESSYSMSATSSGEVTSVVPA